jgi:hypothetical protein
VRVSVRECESVCVCVCECVCMGECGCVFARVRKYDTAIHGLPSPLPAHTSSPVGRMAMVLHIKASAEVFNFKSYN